MHEKIRLATLEDAQIISEIYAPYVLETTISFEAIPPSPSEMAERIAVVMEKFPWTVYEDNGRVQGYAYASPFKNRHAYSWSVESTVYVDQHAHRRGIGRALYIDLIHRLKKQGMIQVVGCISLPNDPSIQLHESLGFQQVAHFKRIGLKFDQWWDVGYWQLEIPNTN